MEHMSKNTGNNELIVTFQNYLFTSFISVCVMTLKQKELVNDLDCQYYWVSLFHCNFRVMVPDQRLITKGFVHRP